MKNCRLGEAKRNPTNGREIKPIATTVAATTPVVAAKSAPTKITAKASPPRKRPNKKTKSKIYPLRFYVGVGGEVVTANSSEISPDNIPHAKYNHY